MSKVLKTEFFAKEITEAKGLAIIQFKTEWNGGCQIMAPIYDEISKKFSSKARFFTIDTQDEEAIAKEFRIMELPTILIFKNGELIDNVKGLISKKLLALKIEDVIAHKTSSE